MCIEWVKLGWSSASVTWRDDLAAGRVWVMGEHRQWESPCFGSAGDRCSAAAAAAAVDAACIVHGVNLMRRTTCQSASEDALDTAAADLM